MDIIIDDVKDFTDLGKDIFFKIGGITYVIPPITRKKSKVLFSLGKDSKVGKRISELADSNESVDKNVSSEVREFLGEEDKKTKEEEDVTVDEMFSFSDELIKIAVEKIVEENGNNKRVPITSEDIDDWTMIQLNKVVGEINRAAGQSMGDDDKEKKV